MKHVRLAGPGTAQKHPEAKAVRSAFEIWCLRPSSSIHFVTPEPGKEPTTDYAAQIEALRADFETKLGETTAKLNSAHAKLRELEKGKPAPEGDPTDPPKEPEKKPRQTPADKELAERVAKIEDRNKKVATNAKRNALKSAFTEAGITGEDQADAVDLYMSRNADKLEYDDATDTVRIKESEIDDPKPLSEVIARDAKAGKFNRFKPAKKVPTQGPTHGAPGGANSGGESMTLTEFIAAQRSGQKQNLSVKVTPG